MEWQLGSISSSLLRCPHSSPLLWSPGNRKQQSWQPVCGALYEEYFLLTTGIRPSASSDKKEERCLYQQQPPEVISGPEDLNFWHLSQDEELRALDQPAAAEILWCICSTGISKKGTSVVLHSIGSMHRAAGSAWPLFSALWEYLIWLAWAWAAFPLPCCVQLQRAGEYLRVLSEVRFWYTSGVGP